MKIHQYWYEPFLHEFLETKGREWSLGEMLGEGGSAAVWRVQSPDESYALKVYKPQFLEGDNEVVEKHRVNLQRTLCEHDCQDLIQMHEVGFVGTSAYILMAYVPWPSMDVVLGAIPSSQISTLIACVARAARWLHQRGIVHRDIKPANILVSPSWDRAILVDLGVMRTADSSEGDLTDHGSKRPFVATAQYSSPEYLFRTVEPAPEMWQALTYYQLGAVLHDMLTRAQIFDQEVKACNKYVLAMAVMKKIPSFALAEKNPRLVALASRCLDKSFDSRLENVDWEDFISADVFDADSARRRLLLNSAGVKVGLTGMRRAEEASEIESRLTKATETTLRRICGDEGYKRVTWRSSRNQVILIIELKVQDGGAYFKACFSSRLTEKTSAVTLFMSSGIFGELDDSMQSFGERVLLHVSIDSVDNVEPLTRDLISEELLRAYYCAFQRADGTQISDLPIQIGLDGGRDG
ncbi:protein kinase domain-containing protein [Xanthomonas translucens]|uniref:protein kinase domain-containing protein n=1 Tax=Xanthomonas campestris pv. translucens TaxID=343 RepID=UPI0009BDA28D|nr:protein kinase [Xanthomonas translucens]